MTFAPDAIATIGSAITKLMVNDCVPDGVLDDVVPVVEPVLPVVELELRAASADELLIVMLPEQSELTV